MTSSSYTDKDIYLTVKKIAEITEISERTLKDRCLKNKYTCKIIQGQRGGNGGKLYEILVSSLEPELQDKILNNLLNSDSFQAGKNSSVNTTTYDKARFSLVSIGDSNCININTDNQSDNIPVSLNYCTSDIGGNINHHIPILFNNKTTAPVFLENKQACIPTIPEKAKKLALAKVDLINHWDTFRNSKKDKKQADIDFLELYNSKVLSRQIYAIVGNVSKTSLYRWNKELKENNNDYKALIPGYHYGSETVINTKMSVLERTFIMDLMLRPSKINVGSAYRLVKYALELQGIYEMASLKTYERFALKFKRNRYDIWVLMREGQKALIDKVAPHMQRNPELLEVGDVLVADGHVLDFMVINPYTGKPCRPTLVVYQDWKSLDIAGYEIMVTENTQCIASALRHSIIRLGKCPKICYQDNGRAFRSKFFTGSKNFNDCGFYGLFGSLGIIPVFAYPYNGKAKIAERFFKEFTQTCASLVPSYIGNNIDNRPAYEKRNEKFHKAIHNKQIPNIQQTINIIEEWLKFYRSQPCPHVQGKTIGEVFDEGKGEGVDISSLDDLMMMQQIRKIGRNGVKLFDTLYYAPELYGINDKVIVKYSLFDISRVKIYSLAGEYICDAERDKIVSPMAYHFGDENADKF